jgi:LPS export ABC transporter protein LptC
MITSRNLIWFIPFLIFVSFPLWRIPVSAFLAPRGGYDPTLANRKLDNHNFTMEKVQITQSENGKISLEIVADRVYTGKTPNQIKMTAVDAIITSASNEQTFVTARKGKLDKVKSVLTLIDEVVLMKPKDKFELYSELIVYDKNSNILHSPGRTQVLGEKIDLTGKNLVFNTVTEAYDLDGRVRCKLSNFSEPK